MKSKTLSILLIVAVLVGSQAVAQAAEDGRIQRWLLAGRFADDAPAKLLAKPPADPATLAPSAGDAVGKVKWVEYATPAGVVDFRDKRVGVATRQNCVVMGFVYVYSPKMTPAKLLVGFASGLSAHLNGKQVFLKDTGGGMTPDAYRAEVLLGAGWNRLQIANARYRAFRWQMGFSVRLTGDDLKPIEGLKFSTKNPFPGGKAAMPKFTPYVSAYTVEHFGTHRVRLVNRTPIALANVRLVVRGKTGRELMDKKLGALPGDGYVEADIDVDEVFYQQHFPGATAQISFTGGKLSAVLEPLRLAGTHSVEYKTPHINRMKPWAGGRPVVLLLTGGRTRQAIELVQRGDLEWHYVDTSEKGAAQRIKEELTLYKFDCIVVAGQPWRKIPGFALLSKALTRGAGLVYVNPLDLDRTSAEALGVDTDAARERQARAARLKKVADHPVISGVPLEHLPPVGAFGYKLLDSAKVVAKAGDRAVVAVSETKGRRAVLLNLGRGAQLIWPMPRQAFLDARLPAWERQWSLVLKSIIWAAKRETSLSVTASAKPALTRAEVGAAKVAVTLVGKAKAPGAKVFATFRSRGLTGREQVLDAKGPAGTLKLALPVSLDAGENEVDVRVLTHDGKVAGWGSAVFTIQPRGSIGKITIAPIKPYYLPGDKLTFTVPGKADVDGFALCARLVDNRGRVVAEDKREVKKGAFSETFTLQPKGLLTPVARFQVELDAHTHAEARAQHIFFVRQELVWDSYEPVLWLTRHRANWYYDIDYFRMLRKVMWIPNGWDSGYGPRSSTYYQMVYGGFNRVGMESLHFFSMNHNWTKQTFELRRTHFRRTKDVRWLYRTPIDKKTGKPIDKPDYANLSYGNNPHNSFFPLDDPEYLEWTKRKIARQLKGAAQFNPIVYDLMDEGSYTSYARAHDFDHSPVSLKHFRLWLKGQYGSLAALNKEWETKFAKWDDVMPLHVYQARDRARGKKLPNYAPWVDHRKYGDIVYNRYIKLCSDAARAGGDPDACVGIGGGQRPNPYGGWDYWLVTNHFTWIENYFADTNEYIRSFNTPDRKLKACPGTDVWYSVMHGNCGFYRWVDYGHLRADFTLLPRGDTTARQLAEVRGRGFAKLFLAAKPIDDPIAIHYSQSTIQVSHVRGGPGAADQLGNGGPLVPKLGFYNLLEELGYQYKFVAYAQLEAGELIKKGYKLMILPESIALSDKEAAGLKKFVQAGGVVLCDRNTGVWNEHGRRRKKTVLAEQFGIDPSAPAEKALGKGRVIYLNSRFPHSYWRERNVGNVGGYWKQMKDALTKAGVGPSRARILKGGEPARRTEIRYFQFGKVRYFAVRAEIPGRYTFQSASPGHLYDMRDGRYAAGAKSIAIDASPTFPAILALSPYKVAAVNAKAGKATVRCGRPVSIAASVRAAVKPGDHMLNFRVYGPDGAERRHYSKTLLAKDGAATLTIPTALNDTVGAWKVKVADLASGVVGEAAFEVK